MFLGGSEDLMHAFFGSILTVPQSYVYALIGCCAISLFFTYYFFEALIIHSFDSDFALRAFHHMGWIFKGWLALFVINAAVQFQGIGALVVLGLTILPFLSFYTAGVHIRHILWRSIAWNIVASSIALLLSCHKDWPYGPTVLLLLGAGYAGALVYSRIALPHLWRAVIILAACHGVSDSAPPTLMTSSCLLQHLVSKLLPPTYHVEAISKRSCLHHQPESAQHLMQLSKADMIILHGTGIDTHWIKFLESAGISIPIVVLSDLLPASYPLHATSCNRIDGHVWHDPLYVVQYIKILETVLTKRYPQCAHKIHTSSVKYQQELIALDQWVHLRWQHHRIKAGLVAHDGLFYYQRRYRITLYPVPEDQQHQGRYLTQLMKCPVRAVFPEYGHHDTVCRQWAKDLSIIVGAPLYIDDLPEALSYIQMMHHNTRALHQGLVAGPL
jgi:ABC-type Zn uptake system ZnuABC Zn-binding protein ZnuA